jgi:hypothetical protein
LAVILGLKLAQIKGLYSGRIIFVLNTVIIARGEQIRLLTQSWNPAVIIANK